MALVLLQRKNSKTSEQTGKQEFLEAVREAIKFSGHPSGDIARRVGLHRSVFSTKLNQKNGSFNAPEIKTLLLVLVELQGINRRDELLYLLRLAGLRESAFSQADWQQSPLCELD